MKQNDLEPFLTTTNKKIILSTFQLKILTIDY